eukprot:2634041-Prymnesium_polylepis.1
MLPEQVTQPHRDDMMTVCRRTPHWRRPLAALSPPAHRSHPHSALTPPLHRPCTDLAPLPHAALAN